MTSQVCAPYHHSRARCIQACSGPAQRARDQRARRLLIAFTVFALAVMSAGCGGAHQISSTQINNVPVSFAMTATAATPPVGVSILSFELTLSGAQLEPGNVSLLTSPVTVELARLQAEVSLLAGTTVPQGSYTGISLTFANPMVTFENNTAATIVIGGVSCAPGQVCTAQPPPINLAGTVNFPSTGIALAANVPGALLLNLNLATALSNTLQGNFTAGASVSELASTPAGAPFTDFGDLVGVVTAKNTVNNSLVLQTSLGSDTVFVNSATVFANFPSSLCAAATFACVASNQIVSLDTNLLPDSTLQATKVLFEDADTSRPEIEGIIVATAGFTPPTQFSMVVTRETPSVPGISIGSVVGVAVSSVPLTVFDIDNLGASVATSAFSFQGIQDLMIGQEVQVQQLPDSTNVLQDAGRVRLRSSRITANVSLVAAPEFTLGNATLPSFLMSAGISQIRVITLGPPASNAYTEFAGNAVNISQIVVGNSVSIRAQLFKNGPLVSGVQPAVAVATRVVKH
jgi:hypothetical protein